MPLSINLDEVAFGVADLPAPPGETATPKLLQFHDAESGILVNIPLVPKAVEALVAQLQGRTIDIARAAPPGIDLRKGPGVNGRG